MVKGDGDVVWGEAVTDCLAGKPERVYEGGRIEGSQFLAARWDLMDPDEVYVGLGADHSRMPQALLILQRLADGWAEAEAAQVSERD